MISFASLFVGLVFGIVNVQLIAAAGVDRVELLLDGSRVAELREPFLAQVDLGCEPAPHELVAIARDAKGREIGRVRQWVNRPRATAEASFVLEPGRGDRGRVARLTWRCLTAENPRSVAVTFDEKPLRVTDPARIDVPPHDPAQVHALRAVLEFDGNVRATAEAVFGGPRSAEAVTEMTAVAVVLDKGRSLPPAERLAGAFEADGVPLEVAAVEEGPYDVVLVCEGSALAPFRKLYESRKDPFVPELPLELGFRFLWPVVQMASQKTMVSNIYPISSRFTPVDGTVGFVGTRRLEWPAFHRKGQRIADAVAVAGLSAAEEERRRAVVLVLGPDAEDGSLLSPAEAAGFLEKLRVPLQVWTVGRTASPEARRWPAGTSIQTARQFDGAVASLLESLKSQRVVWVEGTHLPQAVIPAASAAGIRLAR
ncbi:MAG: hypothetical protein U0529_16110 [Thermoanaerobaculia bacterium]